MNISRLWNFTQVWPLANEVFTSQHQSLTEQAQETSGIPVKEAGMDSDARPFFITGEATDNQVSLSVSCT